MSFTTIKEYARGFLRLSIACLTLEDVNRATVQTVSTLAEIEHTSYLGTGFKGMVSSRKIYLTKRDYHERHHAQVTS